MEPPPELRLGHVLVSFFDDCRFVFVDMNETARLITVDDAEVAELIKFLYKKSRSARQRLDVTPRPRATQREIP